MLHSCSSKDLEMDKSVQGEVSEKQKNIVTYIKKGEGRCATFLKPNLKW